jgi:hypothetical protein
MHPEFVDRLAAAGPVGSVMIVDRRYPGVDDVPPNFLALIPVELLS